MKKLFYPLFTLITQLTLAQSPVEYNLDFSNASQNEAVITVHFPEVDTDSLHITMSRSSPGRYALHEFVKNVYDLKAFDSQGEPLSVVRTNPYEWVIPGHDGAVKISYTLFANHADGTYSDISESHAHLNIPATLIYAPALAERQQKIILKLRDDLHWKAATQLQKINDSIFAAPNLYYLMDSPIEISDHQVRSFEVTTKSGKQRINFALHHRGTEEAFDQFFTQVQKIVLEEIAVFGEAPQYDFGEYTFLACYLPWVYGDGMEHRNSTVLTNTGDLKDNAWDGTLGTVTHEYFHSWNVERLRPASLEPFDFKQANMSGELWFAEGFTSYYTYLIMKRAGIISEEEYLKAITPTFNYVWNAPGRNYFTPVEMSYQAPFVDAATSVDPVNRANTFISYYSYGHMLGLALDLRLRELGRSLDGYYRKLWETYGRDEKPYTLDMLENALKEYAGEETGERFFREYIYQSHMPDYKSLFENMGIELVQEGTKPFIGIQIENGEIVSYPLKGSPANIAGLSKGDQILKVNEQPVAAQTDSEALLKERAPGEILTLEIERFGKILTKKVTLANAPDYQLRLSDEADKEVRDRLKEWLGSQI